MARVPYRTRQDAGPDGEAVWERLERERKQPTGHVFRALANAPALLDAFLSYANALRDGSTLDPKLRELAILVVGQATRSEYEVAHHIPFARRAGVTESQLATIASFESSEAFDATERAVMRLARESTVDVEVSDEAWADVAGRLTVREAVELAGQIAWYNGAVRIMAMLDLDLEEGYRHDPVMAGGGADTR